jgi:hypothetical protein
VNSVVAISGYVFPPKLPHHDEWQIQGRTLTSRAMLRRADVVLGTTAERSIPPAPGFVPVRDWASARRDWALPSRLDGGVVYAVHAQDLWESIVNLMPRKKKASMPCIRRGLISFARVIIGRRAPQPECQRYTNGSRRCYLWRICLTTLTGSTVVLYGNDHSIAVLLPVISRTPSP